jgi:hypothetical protein
MKPHAPAYIQTLENRLFNTAKPLFIGSIPIAASNLLNNLQAAQSITEK